MVGGPKRKTSSDRGKKLILENDPDDNVKIANLTKKKEVQKPTSSKKKWGKKKDGAVTTVDKSGGGGILKSLKINRKSNVRRGEANRRRKKQGSRKKRALTKQRGEGKDKSYTAERQSKAELFNPLNRLCRCFGARRSPITHKVKEKKGRENKARGKCRGKEKEPRPATCRSKAG